MACPMNCPKTLRNGPCGGVRQDGGCEIKPEMTCVWVKAWEGSQHMGEAESGLQVIQLPVDTRLKGRSSWLGALKDRRETSGRGLLTNPPQEKTCPFCRATFHRVASSGCLGRVSLLSLLK